MPDVCYTPAKDVSGMLGTALKECRKPAPNDLREVSPLKEREPGRTQLLAISTEITDEIRCGQRPIYMHRQEAAFRRKAMSKSVRLAWLQSQHAAHLPEIFNDDPRFSESFVKEIGWQPSVTVKNAAMVLENGGTSLVRIENNRRRTTDTPPAPQNHIYILGNSRVYGTYCEDADTIPSHLQRKCNEIGMPCEVVNAAVSFNWLENVFMQLQSIPLKKGDYVAYFRCAQRDKTIPYSVYLDMMQRYCHKHEAFFAFIMLPRLEEVTSPSSWEQILASTPYENLFQGKREVGSWSPQPPSLQKSIDRLSFNVCVCVDLQYVLNRPHDLGEVWVDKRHFTHRANKAIANAVYDRFIGLMAGQKKKRYHLERAAIIILKDVVLKMIGTQKPLKEWIKSVPKFEKKQNETIGAIIMNCNPFTNGHLHIITQALTQVSRLYIFTVEEDRSIFPFIDRIRLIKEGTAHFGDRVIVHPSGNYIISSFSFPEYFTKDVHRVEVDASLDVAIFGSIIAPPLKITTRFVGEEPFCVVTNSYNQAMLRILPHMGVAVNVFPRLEHDGKGISASEVRRMLDAKNFDGIQRLVPPTTFTYLKSRSEDVPQDSAPLD